MKNYTQTPISKTLESSLVNQKSQLIKLIKLLTQEVELLKDNQGLQLYSVNQVADLLSCSRPKVYELINEGKLKAVQLFSNKRIPFIEIQAYLASLPVAKQKPLSQKLF